MTRLAEGYCGPPGHPHLNLICNSCNIKAEVSHCVIGPKKLIGLSPLLMIEDTQILWLISLRSLA